ncbi:MAG TPA: thioredoxin domain-containing protein [Candidatus Binataceae bacterium]|nr:thioredoxin domain-containing protein [Candidatus Binataceae bacterium]
MAKPGCLGFLGVDSQGGIMRSAIVIAVTVIGLAGATPATARSTGGDDGQTAALVGGHKITVQELDTQVLANIPKSQLYNLRKQALDQMIDKSVVDAAAKKANLTPDNYLKTELKVTPVTEADAKKYYEAHKAGIDAQTNNKPFDQIKTPLMNALQNHQEHLEREAFLEKLRDQENVKVLLKPPRSAIASAGHPWTGGENATVTVVEFSDFQCPYCRAAEPTVKAIRDKYGDKVKFVYMDFPLGMHQHAMDAANAAQCASDQGKFWQYHDALFADQTKLDAADLKATAAKLGLDTKKFDTCFDSQSKVPGIRAEQAEGGAAGVSATPTFFVNGREIEGAEAMPVFQDMIDGELADAGHPAKMASAGTKTASDGPQADAH